MDNIQLIKLQKTLCIIAREIKRICDENDIQYSMIGGTLIGAVRHKGFVPWDDDMDFVMTRQNYNKFLEVCEKQLGESFEVLNWNTNRYFGSGFTKIQLKGTVAVEFGKVKAKYPQKIFVDIFPFDSVPDSKIERFFQKSVTYFCIKVLQQKDGSDIIANTKIKKLGYRIIRIISSLFSHKFLVNICEKMMTKYMNKETKCLTSIAGFYGYNREIICKELFDDYVDLKFEDVYFTAFGGYDSYLRMVFGDYMKLPPIEKRRTHGFEVIDFGKY